MAKGENFLIFRAGVQSVLLGESAPTGAATNEADLERDEGEIDEAHRQKSMPPLMRHLAWAICLTLHSYGPLLYKLFLPASFRHGNHAHGNFAHDLLRRAGSHVRRSSRSSGVPDGQGHEPQNPGCAETGPLCAPRPATTIQPLSEPGNCLFCPTPVASGGRPNRSQIPPLDFCDAILMDSPKPGRGVEAVRHLAGTGLPACTTTTCCWRKPKRRVH